MRTKTPIFKEIGKLGIVIPNSRTVDGPFEITELPEELKSLRKRMVARTHDVHCPEFVLDTLALGKKYLPSIISSYEYSTVCPFTRKYIEETILFVLGTARTINYEHLSHLAMRQDGDDLIEKNADLAYETPKEFTKLFMDRGRVKIEEVLVTWCDQKNGVHDLVETMYRLYGGN